MIAYPAFPPPSGIRLASQQATGMGDRLHPDTLIDITGMRKMSPYYSDTHPTMEALQIQLLRETPPWCKMKMLAGLNRAARDLALAGLARRHPRAGEGELRRRLAGLLLGEDLACKVYGELADGL